MNAILFTLFLLSGDGDIISSSSAVPINQGKIEKQAQLGFQQNIVQVGFVQRKIAGCRQCKAGTCRGGCRGKLSGRNEKPRRRDTRIGRGKYGPEPASCYQPNYGCYPGSRFMHRYPAFHGTYYRRPYNYRNVFDYPWHAGLHEPTSHFSYNVRSKIDQRGLQPHQRLLQPPRVPPVSFPLESVENR